MRFQMLSAVALVETSCDFVRRIYVYADTMRILRNEPFSHATKQPRRDAVSPVLRLDGNPLQLSFTTEAACEVSCNKADDALTIRANE